MTMPTPHSPLTGIRVLDLTQIYNGPYATYLMAMAGAEVIKIEPPEGEHLRKRGANSGAALPFAMLNGNKKSITLNLKSPEGKSLLLRLAETADVLVQNFAPGVMERLGLASAVLRARNPRLVIASGSGFGSDGPYRDFPAMDLTVQAISGVMSVTGQSDGPPLKAGPAVCDFFGGVHLYGAIMTALFDRSRTGIGREVEVSMMEAVYASLSSNLGLYYGSGGRTPIRNGNRHGGMSLCPYNVYPTQDGYVAIICNHQRHWEALVLAMGQPALGLDPRMTTMKDRVANMDFVDDTVGAWTGSRGKQAVFDLLTQHRVPCAPVRDISEVVADPHLRARGMLKDIEHPEFGAITVASSPIRFTDMPPLEPRASRRLGEDNGEILCDFLNEPRSQLDALRARGVI
jgi:CoA:oxalate CoA-transferase